MASVGRMVKASIVEELSAALSKQPNFFVTAITRLPASETDAFRRKLSTSQAHLMMISRRLGRRAVGPLNLSGLQELLEGSVGLVLAGDDVLPTAKLIVEFRKAHEEQLSVRGAVIDGQLLDTSAVEALASLPARPVLLAQVVATIESPIAEVILTLERLIGDLAWLAEQLATRKPNSNDGTPEPEHT
jgi:large subunit ribosomal protein L10